MQLKKVVTQIEPNTFKIIPVFHDNKKDMEI